MADAVWYYARGERRVGPFTLAQLRQMADAGMVGPGDRVMAEGGSEWVTASAVPGLFPPPAVPAGTAGALVACGKCGAGVSDVADHCPRCGHPQPPLTAKERNEELHPCPHCGTTNPVRNYWHFRRGDACRGCGRLIPEAYPEKHYEYQVDQLFLSFALHRNALRWPVYGLTAVAVGAAASALFGLLGHGWAVAAGVLGGLGGAGLAPLLWSEVYRAVVARRGHPRHPADGRCITRIDWVRAESRYNAGERSLCGNDKAVPAAWSGWAGWAAVAVVLIGFAGLGIQNEQEQAKKKAADLEARVGAEVGRGITLAKSGGVFSHDLHLTNVSAQALGGCELVLTVYTEDGRREPVTLYWATWAAGEEKMVTVPARGRVERVTLTGAMTTAGTNQKGRVALTFDWKAGKP
jgi:hypothetical protein